MASEGRTSQGAVLNSTFPGGDREEIRHLLHLVFRALGFCDDHAGPKRPNLELPLWQFVRRNCDVYGYDDNADYVIIPLMCFIDGSTSAGTS